jgi:hypothetical protein
MHRDGSQDHNPQPIIGHEISGIERISVISIGEKYGNGNRFASSKQ